MCAKNIFPSKKEIPKRISPEDIQWIKIEEILKKMKMEEKNAGGTQESEVEEYQPKTAAFAVV